MRAPKLPFLIRGGLVAASGSDPERPRALPAPAQGFVKPLRIPITLRPSQKSSGEGDPLRGKGPPKGVQSLLPSVACAGKKPRSGKPERGFAFCGGRKVCIVRAWSREG